MNLGVWLSIASIILTVILGFSFAYYSQPIANFREERIKRVSLQRSERGAYYRGRAIEFSKGEGAFTQKLVWTVLQLVTAFSAIVIGLQFITIGYVMSIAGHLLTVQGDLSDTVFRRIMVGGGSLTCSMGIMMLFWITNDQANLQRAMKKLTEEGALKEKSFDDSASVQSTVAHTPSDPSVPLT
jgi:hypothetical protein